MDKKDNVNQSSSSGKMDSQTESATKAKSKNRGKKRKRPVSGSSSEYEDILPDNALAMEKNLHASAVKNNLDEISVRKILKKVVTNDHVLALVKLREEAEDSGPEEKSLRPKLTRAKVKELMKVSPQAAAWNLENLELTPIKHIPVKTRPEVKALIAQELPEDEDDDEYEPTNEDVPSDDDQGLESCSDLDSQPRTPATPRSVSTSSPLVVKDGPFKVPQDVATATRRKLDLEEDATIALRTRSKLSLSATSIEHIESTFVPPDDLPMPAVDDLWNEFLNECLNPASTSKHEDDDETDPEYNVAADQDAHDEDEEALGKSLIKISKKELNDLVTELFNIMPEGSVEDELMTENMANSVLTEHSQNEVTTRWEGKQEPVSDEEKNERFSDRITFEKRGYTRLSTGKTEQQDTPQPEVRSKKSGRGKGQNKVPRSVDIAIEEREEGAPDSQLKRAPPLLRRHLRQPKTQYVTIQVDEGVKILPEQITILQQQLRQHIQLATSNYLQLYVHPVHWSFAPTYKEYLESLSKLGASNPQSVVNVCNLQPAVELVKTWELTVAENTPENKEMVEFIHNESERCRRRFTQKSLYVGEFHDTFKKVVANSPVFLYPYLLPAMPYRADHVKRYAYIRSEDELIALGLDQFWDFVEANPSSFKPRGGYHPRHRWGLGVTLQLVVKHMFPWIPYKVLLAHIHFLRRMDNDKTNPINKFFKSRTITPVKHKLLPFNPKLSLYEQPEHEMPKIWVRYLAKTSKRFRNYLLRRTGTTGVAPQGVEIQLGQSIPQPTKAPLPIDFTKEIVSNRINIFPKTPRPLLADKFDIQIATSKPPIPPTSNIAPSGIIQPINLFRLVETSTGAYLLPITDITTTVNTNLTPISTPAEVTSQIVLNNLPESSISLKPNLTNLEHCSCCVLLRKIVKQKQTVITDFFRENKLSKSCYCKDVKFPKITNRLRLLVSNYKSNSVNALQSLEANIKRLRSKDKGDETDSNKFDLDDFAFVTSFHLKLLTRTTSARDSLIKRRVYSIISRFNPSLHDPIQLTMKLSDAFKVELVDVYKEFLCFLTPEQADQCGAFRDYFVRNCVEDLVKRIETLIPGEEVRLKVLRKIHNVFNNNLMSACEICTEILSMLNGYPKLAEYVFSLFPHRKEGRHEPKLPLPPTIHNEDESIPAHDEATDQAQTNVNYEADHSSSEEEEENNGVHSEFQGVLKSEITTSDNELLDPSERDVTMQNAQDSSDSSNGSMTIAEDVIKPEASEWKRDEDKLILEILKEHLTPQERKDRTILEIFEEKKIIDMIADSLIHKSKDEITKRVLYLLAILVLSEK